MKTTTISSCFLALAIAALGMPAAAQEDVTIMEEIVVLATKRAQTLQEVPVAVSVISADAIADSQVLDVKDLQFLVPSLKIGQLQSTANTNFRIRGFGNGANNAGIEPSVGVFIDGVYRSRSASALADLPNLERIEVLRGPQSTLFGKNASAGVINVVTAKPNLYVHEGSVSATIGDYNQVLVKADVNGPLSDTAGFSLSGSYNQRDGYFTNLTTGGKLSELNRYGIRGQLYFVPSDTVELRFIGDFEKMDELCCGVANLFEHPVPAAGIRLAPEVENSGLSMQLDWDISDDITLTSITAFRKHERYDNADSDFSSANLISRTASNLTDSEIDTFTQELRFQGSTDSMNWMAGLYYFDEEISTRGGVLYGADYRQYANVFTKALAWEASCELNPDPLVCNPDYLNGLLTDPSIPSPIDSLEAALQLPAGTLVGNLQGMDERSGMDNQALSVFAQFDFDLSDRATLTLGANYTEDEKDAFVNIVTTDIFSALSMEQIGFGLAFQGACCVVEYHGLQPGRFAARLQPAITAAGSAIPAAVCRFPECGRNRQQQGRPGNVDRSPGV
jgi:outer membrane receptor protein involved in Fe transport